MLSFISYFNVFLGSRMTLMFVTVTANCIVFISGAFELSLSFSSIYFCFCSFDFLMLADVRMLFSEDSGEKDGSNCVFKYVINRRTGCWMYETSKSLI
jgi:hypothetical protein